MLLIFWTYIFITNHTISTLNAAKTQLIRLSPYFIGFNSHPFLDWSILLELSLKSYIWFWFLNVSCSKLRGIKNCLFNHSSGWSVAAYKSTDLWYLKKQTFWFTDLKKVLVGFKWCLFTKKNVVFHLVQHQTACRTFSYLLIPSQTQQSHPNCFAALNVWNVCLCTPTPPDTHMHTHTLPEYPLGSFWIFIKETPTAATDRWAGVLTPGSGSLPIKTHRTKNIPPHWPRQQTFTSTKTRSLPASLSCPSCCSAQHSFKSIYMSCVINPISSGSSCSVKKKKEKEEEGKKYLFGSFQKWVSILYLFMAVYLHVICVYTYARVLQIFLPFKDRVLPLIQAVMLIVPT